MNDFGSQFPELAEEWSSRNSIRADEVLYTRNFTVYWDCPVCHGTYPAKMRDRKISDDACPYCNNRKVLPGLNDFATVHPELIAEWSPNNDMKPSEVLAMRQHRVLWICPECRGEYAWPVNERHFGDNACPYCNNRKVLPGYNSLLVQYPELMPEWDTINNLFIGVDADQISPRNIQPIWWICNSCGYHYRMATSRRIMYETRHQIACSKCKGRRQKRRFNG